MLQAGPAPSSAPKRAFAFSHPTARHQACRHSPLSASSSFWLRPIPSQPAYNKYRSRDDIKASTTEKYWKIVDFTRETPATFKSCVAWFPSFVKYDVIPLPIKFVVFSVWSPIRTLLFRMHKSFVLLCCKIDVWSMRKDSGCSVKLAMDRLHGKRKLSEDIAFWKALRREASGKGQASPA